MGNIRHPRRGSLQYWPRKRSRHALVRIRSWVPQQKAKPLGFIGYKAGMTHLFVVDNQPKSLTKGEKISLPATIIECPPMTVVGVAFYRLSSHRWRKIASILMEKPAQYLDRQFQLPKKATLTLDKITDFDDVRLLVASIPQHASAEAKKPKVLEISLGGAKEDKITYAKNVLGKEIAVTDVFDAGNQVDIHGVTKGKGFQGTVKRYGVPIRQHKAEKTKRGIGTLGSWTPKRVEYTVPLPGKMGYHQRTEYNKRIIKIGSEGKDVTPAGGINRYGVVKNTYLLVKGSIVGPQKRAIVLTPAIRPNSKVVKDAPEVTYIAK